jgi:anti-sigma factor RsiW
VSTHDEVPELLPAYAAGELDTEAQERVTRALAESARLREELARYRRLFVVLAALAEEDVAPDAGFDRRVMRQIAIQWYLGTTVRFLEGIVGAYGRAVRYYLGGPRSAKGGR